MNASIKNLISANPSGLLELKNSCTIPQYRDNFGFRLENIWTIYKSKKVHHSDEDYFAFGKKPLNELFTVNEESTGDLLVVYIIETIKGDRVYCHLVLADAAYQAILSDSSQHLLKVHQMYTKFFPEQDFIALNMETVS